MRSGPAGGEGARSGGTATLAIRYGRHKALCRRRNGETARAAAMRSRLNRVLTGAKLPNVKARAPNDDALFALRAVAQCRESKAEKRESFAFHRRLSTNFPCS